MSKTPIDLNFDDDEGTIIRHPVVVELGTGYRYVAAETVDFSSQHSHEDYPQQYTFGFVVDNSVRPAFLVSRDDVNVKSDGTVTFDTRTGSTYTLRRLEESDGEWLGPLLVPTPVEELEKIADNNERYAYSEGIDMDPASAATLFFTFNDDGSVHELVYSGETGMYIRADGGWHMLPEDDDSLDGYDVMDVVGEAIEFFDKAEQDGNSLTRDDVAEFDDESESDVEETEE